MTTAIVLWIMTFGVNPHTGQPETSKWGAVDTFATIAECKQAAQNYEENVFQMLKKHSIIGQAKCLPAGTQP